MAILIEVPDTDEVICSSCDAVFFVHWHASPLITGIEYCPFCGEEVEAQGK